jgi:REP element-mobilizing transposase RayT
MKYDPDKHHRRSIRLKGYDYSAEGACFVTICTRNRECLFGQIADGIMVLNEHGEIATRCWLEIPDHFPQVELDEYIVMPNHLHGVLVIRCRGEAFGAPNASPLPPQPPHGTQPGSLGAIIQNYKSISTRKINHQRKSPGTPVWQRNYYEHVVRNEKSLDDIRSYILSNPSCWDQDEENPSPQKH